MSEQSVGLTFKERIAIITFNRPERRNAFNLRMWQELQESVRHLEKNLPRAVIVTGAGEKAFSAGFDVNPDNPQVAGLIDAVKNNNRKPVFELIQYIRAVTDSLVSLPVPVIAAINGLAYGGGAELAVRCDMRIAEPSAIICFSEVSLGLMPDWGGGVALSRLLGQAKAADLILTARKINADEAFRMGLLNRISMDGEVLNEAIELAEKISQNGPRAVRAALSVIRNAGNTSLQQALEFESETAATLIASGECFHGITAFMQSKKPVFPDIE